MPTEVGTLLHILFYKFDHLTRIYTTCMHRIASMCMGVNLSQCHQMSREEGIDTLENFLHIHVLKLSDLHTVHHLATHMTCI